jgi:hypothetical protein
MQLLTQCKAVPLKCASTGHRWPGAQVPIWFCVACPAVLGLLAPLVINAGLGALADTACRHWQLPAEECNDLWCAFGTCFAIFKPPSCAPDAGPLALDIDSRGVDVYVCPSMHALG